MLSPHHTGNPAALKWKTAHWGGDVPDKILVWAAPSGLGSLPGWQPQGVALGCGVERAVGAGL